MSLWARILEDYEILHISGRLPLAAFLALAFGRLLTSLGLYLFLTLVFWMMEKETGSALFAAFSFFYLLMVPLTIRRFHDFGGSTWFASFVLSAPIIIQLYAALFIHEGNAAGFFIAFSTLFVTPAALVLLAMLTLLPSSRGSNKYGPNLT